MINHPSKLARPVKLICIALVLAGAPILPSASSAFATGTEASEFGVGDTLPADQLHVITNPGLYGLGPEPSGSKYAVASGKLIRIDAKSGKVLSILRGQSEVLD